MRPLLLLLAPLLFLLLPGASASALDDEGWTIPSFTADYTVKTDGSVNVIEDIQVDFGSQEHHGIFRELDDWNLCIASPTASEQRITPCNTGDYRSYAMHLTRVSGADGRPLESLIQPDTFAENIRIGDPSFTVSGLQTYHLEYTVHGALDAYPNGDELYWNVTGLDWAAHSIDRFTMTLHLPPGANAQVDCVQGPEGSSDACTATADGSTITYASKGQLAHAEGVTVVARWQKGLVNVEQPYINVRPGMVSDAPQPDSTTIGDLVTLDPLECGGILIAAALVIGSLYLAWWRHGRDRRYRTLYYLTNDASEGTAPLFSKQQVVVEFLPPDDLRPAEMGVILDERADTLDVTATIVDLAVRGWLHITEIPKDGTFGHTDWELKRLTPPDDKLRPYEQQLLDGLFRSGDDVRMSSLKDKFVERLETVKTSLYDDAMQRQWFAEKPEKTRGLWVTAAIGVELLGWAAMIFCGLVFGRALIGAPLVVGGLVLIVLARAMARRTAAGSEALRRVLGFRLYISTAETRRQEFNEQKNIFERYLPFAIVFGCVTKWAKAFDGLDDEMKSTNSWYTSPHPFQVAAFASGLQSFSSSVSSNISSSPSSSGSSGGGGGGFSGGGGGGGGGGSW